MSNDKILEMFFDMERWQYALEKGVDKDINKGELTKLTNKKMRAFIYQKMLSGEYEIAPPHTAAIPKDDGTDRIVYVNEPIDRVLLSIANDLLFDLMPEMVHQQCKSYQRGIGCGQVVQEISREICKYDGDVIGWKADLSKYFDSVPLQFIDDAFDKVETKHGHSALIDVLRKYYHCNIYFDLEGNVQDSYQSLKQGCAVASWLANVVLKHLDERISKMDVKYVRYSDDIMCVGKDYEKAMAVLVEELQKMDMKLNPKKVEYISPKRWVKFLGYSIKGSEITLSKTRIKTFQKEIEKRTIKAKTTLKRALTSVYRYLYKGNGDFSWATQILPVVTVRKDIDELNKFVMDALRAVETGKKKIGGLGYVVDKVDGCIARGTGRNVTANRLKVSKIDGYHTIGCMYNAIRTRRGAYNALVAQL